LKHLKSAIRPAADGSFEFDCHPHLMDLIAAAYGYGYAQAPIRGYGAEGGNYGRSIRIDDETWQVLTEMRETPGIGKEMGAYFQHREFGGEGWESFWIPFRELGFTVARVSGVQVDE
jgi:hypothetical protein